MRSKIIPFIVLSIIVFLNCSGSQRGKKDIAPFFDGLYLRYTDDKASVRGDILYTIRKVSNKYEIIKDDSNKSNILGEIIKLEIRCIEDGRKTV